MAALSIAQAAQLCRINRSTILRSIKNGKISGTRDGSGAWQVEMCELERVFPVAQASHEQVPQVAQALESEIAGLKAMNELLRLEVERWHAQAERLALAAPARAARSWWRRLAK